MNNMDPKLGKRLIENISQAISDAYGGQCAVQCPHCGANKQLPVVPLNPVLVCICTDCNRYVLPFAGQLLPLNTNVVQNGNEEERKFEVVQAIMKLLHEAVRSMVRKKIGEDEVGGVDGPESGEIPDGM